MTTKDELVQKIKEWITYDDNIKSLQKQLKEHKLNQKNVTDDLLDIMKTNEIDCFDINNGKLMFCKNKVKQAINKKTLLLSLSKYFENIPSVDAEKVSEFILDNREIKLKENLRRK